MSDYRWPRAVTEQVDSPSREDGQHGQPNVFIQWKGTDACFDFTCECGFNGHFDGYFAYTIKCRQCGAIWEMPADIVPRKVTPGDGSYPRDDMHVVPGDDNDALGPDTSR